MIQLTPEQEDALIEIGNIGMSKAAKQLSLLLDSPIKITIPKINFMSIDEIAKANTIEMEQIYSLVAQTLSKDLEGSAALMFRREHAILLTMPIIDKPPEFTPEEVRACEHEAMLEIGNIIISSCISVIANMLSQTVPMSFPVYKEGHFVALLNQLCEPICSSQKKLIAITTQLDTYHDQLLGNLFIILTEESVSNLLNQVKILIGR